VAQFIEVPSERLEEATLDALLQEFASRDGTDYGLVERNLSEKVGSLRSQLRAGSLRLLYDGASEQWDLVPLERAQELLA
jgi:uncharacterized protein YheU (UPF0270 family)